MTVATLASGWTVATLFHPDHATALNAVATRIMAGDSFRGPALASLLPDVEAAERREPCNPLEIRSATIIRLRVYEDAVNTTVVKVADEHIRELQQSVELALRCVPTDSFLWFIRYWTLLVRGGVSTDQVENLAMSYRLGPHEGWIALRRNAYALAVYDTLPADVATMVRDEFVSMVGAGFVKNAEANLRSSAPPLRDLLVSSLSKLKQPQPLLALDRLLRDDGIALPIPGVPEKEVRPWRN